MSDIKGWSVRHFLALLAGDEPLLSRLREDGEYAVQTFFSYPGREELVIYLTAAGGTVRISEGGRLLSFLESQGMDLSVDVVISKTVWHAAQEFGGKLGNGRLYAECSPDQVPETLAAFTQALIEVIGLRHCKYKDAIVKLEQGRTFDDPFAPPTP